MKIAFRIIFRAIIFILLTILTQTGGVIYLLSLWLSKRWKYNFRFKTLLAFTALYFLFTFLIIPVLAPVFGREKVKQTDNIQPANYATRLFNRDYVKPELNKLLAAASTDLKSKGITITYLDANFPFIDRFPLLPHLSHNDGKKIDLSLIYENTKGEITSEQKSRSGYGSFEGPHGIETNKINDCLDSGYFQYDYPKYLTFGKINDDLHFSQKGTKELIEVILKQEALDKLFLEPHLVQRLNLNNAKIRYHGCRAVRHDDHIHIQLR